MKPCPDCGGSGTISVGRTLAARPIGTWSLAGAQLKTSATETAVLRCSACGWSVTGRIVGAQLGEDGKTFTGGHFIADPPREDT